MSLLSKKQKKTLKKKLFWLRYFWLIGQQCYKTSRVARKFRKKNRLDYLNVEMLGLRNSETIFILGSGSSINQFQKEDWNEIKTNDSIGLNAWFIHDFVPSAYSFETPNNPESAKDFANILSKKRRQYVNVPIILKDLVRVKPNLNDMPDLTYKIPWDIELPGQNEKQFRTVLKHVRFLKQRNLLSSRLVLKKRASISMLVMLAWRLNYKKIVLCGVDLNNTAYFFQDQSEDYEKKGFPIPKTGQTGKVHRTLDENHGEMTIDKVLYSINDVLLKPDGVKLYVASSSSALYPELPSYFGANPSES